MAGSRRKKGSTDLPDPSRRTFLKQTAATVAVSPLLIQDAKAQATQETAGFISVTLRVNGKDHRIQIEPRVTLLDALREKLALVGTKKGCDQGACGACTVLVDGKRINSCLTLAVMQEGKSITTIEGLARGEELHPMQAAFIRNDGFQCGYCTPGQICSAVACVSEGHAGSDQQIREWMSGNLCRCGAYVNIVSAIREVAKGGGNASV